MEMIGLCLARCPVGAWDCGESGRGVKLSLKGA
jgi:hypothetical protein